MSILPKIIFKERKGLQAVPPLNSKRKNTLRGSRDSGMIFNVSINCFELLDIKNEIEISEMPGYIIIRVPDIDAIKTRKINKYGISAYTPSQDIVSGKEYFGELINESIIFKIY